MPPVVFYFIKGVILVERLEMAREIQKGAVGIYEKHSFEKRLLSSKPLIVKFGADPSRPDLHLGHSVPLRKLRLFQEMGHKVVFVIGDFTGMIGDPSGKSKTRPALTLEETRRSGETYFRQVGKILDTEKIEIAYNSQWLSDMSFSEVLAMCSKYTVARILERDDFQKRFSKNQPISMHELLYPLVQGYDSVALHADVEVGGTDQTFNLLVGRTLQSAYGQIPQEVITYPLLVGLDGKEKMSKSLDNYIGLDEPAATMFEKAMRVPDDVLLDYFLLTTDISEAAAKAVIAADIREAHFVYAGHITALYHGPEQTQAAKQRYLQIASGNVPGEMREYKLEKTEIPLPELLREVGFASSNAEARRQIAGRGVKINGETVADVGRLLVETEPYILQFGKNRFVKVMPQKM